MFKDRIPEKLIESINNNTLLLFVGAGLSTQAGYPDWNRLTINILKGLKDKESKALGYVDTIEKGLFQPIEILKKIEHLENDAIEIFDLELKQYNNIKPLEIHEKITELSSQILTTNYDHLIEKAATDFEKITYYNEFRIAKISHSSKYIFKLHGDIEEPAKCILFPSKYEQLYSTKETCAVFQLKKIISDKSVLFIGFSLTDPYIKYVFDYIRDLHSGFSPDHFIITTDEQMELPEKVYPIILDSYDRTINLIDYLIQFKKESSNENVISIENNEDEFKEDSLKIISNECDAPLTIKYWVGREREIENISNHNFKVVFITGIGGQGKSALASYFLKEKFDDAFEFGDWRDFKEETNRFQTKLISIILRLTNGAIDTKRFEEISYKDLIETFFYYLKDRKIIFVFDNIDSYIDLENFKPSGPIGLLLDEALNRDHNSKFIFTCRPFIREASVNFYQISLEGLSIDETINLFRFYNTPIKKEKLSSFCVRVHKLTKGHPLWLNLIAAQTLRGVDIVEKFIEGIEKGTNFDEQDFSSILSQSILTKVWDSLNNKQKILLRGIAETVIPETVEILSKVLESELNNNQFTRSLQTLRNLNLIESKKSNLGDERIELHPLVKEFILTKFQKNDRIKFITLLVKYYDQYIYILKPKLNSGLPLASFQYWTSKIELEVNKGDFKNSLTVLQEVYSPLLTEGYSEEYLRVAEKIFNVINWSEAIEKEYPYFSNQLSHYFTVLTQQGKYSACENGLEKYEQLISVKSSLYLSFCSNKCYLFWYQGKFLESIAIGEKGEFFLNSSHLVDNYSLRHNLALARRDSCIDENIYKSMNYFLQNESLEDLISSKRIEIELGGYYYGNIGRCLYLLHRYDDAFHFYIISLKLILTENNEHTKLNIGYACEWISEILVIKEKVTDALHFSKYAINNWLIVSPPRFNRSKEKWDSIVCDKEAKEIIFRKSEWEIEQYCQKYINELT